MRKVDVDRTLVAGCLHVPFQHEAAWEATLDFIKYWKPNRIIMNGDMFDLYNCGRWYKSPNRKTHLKDEIQEGRKQVERLRNAARNADIILNLGNHEYRWIRYIEENASEFSELEELQFENVFHLSKHGYHVNYGKRKNYARYALGDIMVGHFEVARKHSADTEQALVQEKGCTVITSHSHRMGRYFMTKANGYILEGVGTGCLCDPDQQEYVEDPNWQNGFVIIEKMSGKSRYWMTEIPIAGGNILFDGRLF